MQKHNCYTSPCPQIITQQICLAGPPSSQTSIQLVGDGEHFFLNQGSGNLQFRGLISPDNSLIVTPTATDLQLSIDPRAMPGSTIVKNIDPVSVTAPNFGPLQSVTIPPITLVALSQSLDIQILGSSSEPFTAEMEITFAGQTIVDSIWSSDSGFSVDMSITYITTPANNAVVFIYTIINLQSSTLHYSGNYYNINLNLPQQLGINVLSLNVGTLTSNILRVKKG